MYVCHTPIFDPNCHWHMSLGPTFVRSLIWSISDFQWKFRQRDILKYLIFDSESGPLLTLSLFFNCHLYLNSLVNFNFVYKNLYCLFYYTLKYLIFLLFVLVCFCPYPKGQSKSKMKVSHASASQTQV